MPSRKQAQLILFDLGNVLVELDGFPWFPETGNNQTGNKLQLDELHRRWLSLKSVRLFETGKMDENIFFQQALDELSLEKYGETLESFTRKYKNWVINFYPEARGLLAQLKSEYRIACLSNTNACHIRHLKEISNELHFFDYCFFSHEIGHVKPDPLAFHHVIKALSLSSAISPVIAPENILFLDDSIDNVNAAIQCGMQAEQVFGIKEVKQRLTSLLAT